MVRIPGRQKAATVQPSRIIQQARKNMEVLNSARKTMNSESLNAKEAGSFLDTAEIKNAITQKLTEVMTSYDFGFSEEEAAEYSAVDVTTTDDNRIRVEVRAEISFEGLMTLMDELNPIVQSYDKDAYFDAEEPGIASAYLDAEALNSANTELNSAEDDEDKYPEGSEFFAMVENEGPEIHRITKEGGRWYEYSYYPTESNSYISSYMGYLEPEDILSWLRTDYSSAKLMDEEDVNEYVANRSGEDEDDEDGEPEITEELWFLGDTAAARVSEVKYPSGTRKWEGWVYAPVTDASGDTPKTTVEAMEFESNQFGLYAMLKELQNDANDNTLQKSTQEEVLRFIAKNR